MPRRRLRSGTQFCVIQATSGFERIPPGHRRDPDVLAPQAQRAQAVAARCYASSAGSSAGRQRQGLRRLRGHVRSVLHRLRPTPVCGNWCDGVDSTNGEVVLTAGRSPRPSTRRRTAATRPSPPTCGPAAHPRPTSGGPRPVRRQRRRIPMPPASTSIRSPTCPAGSTSTPTPITGDQLHVGTMRSIEIDAPPSRSSDLRDRHHRRHREDDVGRGTGSSTGPSSTVPTGSGSTPRYAKGAWPTRAAMH